MNTIDRRAFEMETADLYERLHGLTDDEIDQIMLDAAEEEKEEERLEDEDAAFFHEFITGDFGFDKVELADLDHMIEWERSKEKRYFRIQRSERAENRRIREAKIIGAYEDDRPWQTRFGMGFECELPIFGLSERAKSKKAITDGLRDFNDQNKPLMFLFQEPHEKKSGKKSEKQLRLQLAKNKVAAKELRHDMPRQPGDAYDWFQSKLKRTERRIARLTSCLARQVEQKNYWTRAR